MPGRLEFDLGFPHAGRPRRDSEPMRVLIAGDFSGRPPAERNTATSPGRSLDTAVVRQQAARLS